MMSLAVAALLGTAALGVLLGAHYLGGSRRPGLVTLHLALGGLGAWLFFLLLQAPPAGLAPAAGPAAGILLGAAVLGGLLPRLIARRARRLAEWLLALHVFTGIAAFLAVLSWSARP